ncbi:nucleotidyltransferase family protein [Cohnella terricola]|uniref:nucleotidyltransferase family protein n=1 Tax=Cohnella terricola TaxID=1289167 RepID=UPI001FE3CB85|nr:nucleotidyltransferase family protein [Cohnella terricola]
MAAGQSTRMGTNKLRLPLGSKRLGNYALAAALNSQLEHVWVITGEEEADWIDSAFYREPVKRKWSVVSCPEARSGQSRSLKCGVEAAMSTDLSAVMILLADQPCVSSMMIDELLGHYYAGQDERNIDYAAASFNGLARPPVIFDRRMFPELLRLQGDQGARYLIREGGSGAHVDFANPDYFRDVDTMEDYSSLLRTSLWKS